MLNKIESTETCSLGTENRTTPSHTLTSQNTGVVLASELLIHTVEETDLTTANTYVTCGNVGINADIAPQLHHKGLAETHNLGV